jgi:hypothetical protein
MQLDVLFASTVGVLAGLTVFEVSALGIGWEGGAIRLTLQAYRHQPTHQERVPGDRVSVLPVRRP